MALDCDGIVHAFGTSDRGALDLGNDVTESLQPKLAIFGENENVKMSSVTTSDSSSKRRKETVGTCLHSLQ